MKLGAGAWIGIIGGIVGGGIGMIAAIAASPVFGTIFSIVFIAIFGLVFGGLFRGMAVKNKLMKNGVAATAVVKEIHDTGVTVNNDPQIKLLLEVTPPGGSPYLVETRELVSRLQTSLYQVGATLPVKIDPNNKNLCAIDYTAGSSTARYGNTGYSSYATNQNVVTQGPWTGMTSDEANTKLIELNNKNVALMSSGESAKAIITKYTWLGIYVNGNNPAVELELEVIPDSAKPFKAKTVGVIQETSVPRYQPGSEIYVAYDRSDNSQVTVVHS